MDQNLKTNHHILELQQLQKIMIGGLEKKQQTLTFEEIKKMETDYAGMYYGFVSVNWGQGMTLGMAWQKGLEQMEAFVVSKMKIKNHPANKEFLKIHTDWRRHMSKTIMTSDYSEEKLKPDFRKEFLDYGTKCIKEKKQVLNGLYEKYMPKQDIQKQTQIVKLNIAQKKVQNLMSVLSQNTYQRAA